MRAAVLATQHDEDAWRGERPKVARYLAQRMKGPDRALAIADAYHKAPHLMPMPFVLRFANRNKIRPTLTADGQTADR